jgi:sugar phosphate permease
VTLDLPTLSVMQSFAMALAGALLFFYWAQNRRMTVLAVWGTAHLSASLGIIALTLGYTLRQPLCSASPGYFSPHRRA